MTKVILDTDMGNEIDDLFALVYLLASPELELKAVTIEPFSGSPLYPGISLSKANDISYDLTCKIMDLAGKPNLKNRVFKGAEKYYKEDSNLTNPAVEAMAEIVRKDPDTVIAAIGTCANVALFLNIYPELARETKVVWLGGNGLGYTTNHEFNFSQDVIAARKLFSECRDLSVMPCKNIASNLACPESELREYLGNTELGEFLIDQFVSFRDVVFAGKDTVGYSKILWDISVVAYIKNKTWFETVERIGTGINDDETYSFGNHENKADFVVYINRTPLMNDFFNRAIELCNK